MLFIKTSQPNSLNSKRYIDSGTPPVYKCTRCGKTRTDPKGYFFMSKTSPLFTANELYTHICADCVNDLFFEMQTRYKDTKIALMIICCYLDVYFSEELYESIKDNANLSFGNYTKLLNGTQYKAKNFTTSLMELLRNGLKGSQAIQEERETKWSVSELQNKNDAVAVIGYDPFEGYSEIARKFLFNELVKYFDDDIADDTYKLSQVLQIVNNNNQIRQYDLVISSLDPLVDSSKIKDLNGLKKNLVDTNDKMAKENEISVKNRSNKEVGKSTLTFMMKDLREKGFTKAEANYYDQLKSEGSLWAENMSMKAIKQNGFFDENDTNEIKEINRIMVLDLQHQVDDLLEEKRLLLIKVQELENGGHNE